MCLIIVKEKGHSLDHIFKRKVELAMISNPHGVGFGILRASGKLLWERGKWDYKETINKILSYEIVKNDILVFHARYCTHGDESVANVHPFPIIKYKDWKNLEPDFYSLYESHKDVKKQVPLIFHNGTFSYDSKNGMSDTYRFCKEFVSQLDLLDNEDGYNAIKAFTEREFSRVVVLHPEKGISYFGTFWRDTISNLVYSSNSPVINHANCEVINSKKSKFLHLVQ